MLWIPANWLRTTVMVLCGVISAVRLVLAYNASLLVAGNGSKYGCLAAIVICQAILTYCLKLTYTDNTKSQVV